MAASNTYVTPIAGPQSRGLFATLYDRYMDENVGTLAAGIGLFALLTVPAAALAVAAVYGLVATPGDVLVHVEWIERFLPDAVAEPARDLMGHVASVSASSLSLALFGSIVLALLGAQRAMAATMGALNRIAHLRERRTFWRRNAVALALMLGGIVMGVAGTVALVALPRIVAVLGWEGDTWQAVQVVRWPAAFVTGGVYLAVVYRLAPCRRCMTWRGALTGAAAAAALWLLASLGLAWWVANVSRYHAMYGAAGSTLIVLMWFYLGALAILIGGIIAAETRERGVRALVRRREEV
jgi:membrane protein